MFQKPLHGFDHVPSKETGHSSQGRCIGASYRLHQPVLHPHKKVEETVSKPRPFALSFYHTDLISQISYTTAFASYFNPTDFINQFYSYTNIKEHKTVYELHIFHSPVFHLCKGTQKTVSKPRSFCPIDLIKHIYSYTHKRGIRNCLQTTLLSLTLLPYILYQPVYSYTHINGYKKLSKLRPILLAYTFQQPVSNPHKKVQETTVRLQTTPFVVFFYSIILLCIPLLGTLHFSADHAPLHHPSTEIVNHYFTPT